MIRELRPGDMPALAALLAETEPEEPPPTVVGLAHWIESKPPRARFRGWVAEDDGAIVGTSVAELAWTTSARGVGFLVAEVAERARCRGLGSALYELAERYLVEHAARKLETYALAGSPGERFAAKRGFRRTRTELMLRLDPRAADVSRLPELEAEKRAEGFGLVALRAVLHRQRGLHEVYAAACADIPADDPDDDIRFEDFDRHVLRDPELDVDGSFVVVHGTRPVALAFVAVRREHGVATSEMTGTLPEFRGRGLARLVKLAAVRWACKTGIRELATENDGENAPMLALNRSLGYRVTHERAFLAREERAP